MGGRRRPLKLPCRWIAAGHGIAAIATCHGIATGHGIMGGMPSAGRAWQAGGVAQMIGCGSAFLQDRLPACEPVFACVNVCVCVTRCPFGAAPRWPKVSAGRFAGSLRRRRTTRLPLPGHVQAERKERARAVAESELRACVALPRLRLWDPWSTQKSSAGRFEILFESGRRGLGLRLAWPRRLWPTLAWSVCGRVREMREYRKSANMAACPVAFGPAGFELWARREKGQERVELGGAQARFATQVRLRSPLSLRTGSDRWRAEPPGMLA